jgi:hypothetical protein
MKNRIFKKVLILGIGLAFVTQSCNDLEEDLYSDLPTSEFYKTDEQFIAALGSAYSSFAGIGNHSGLWTLNELASDELVVTTKGGDWYDGGVLVQMHQHKYTIDHPFVNGSWGWIFGGINTANRLIYTFEQVGTPQAEAFIAELRAIRALWYYWAIDAFGNVPLVTDFLDAEAPATTPRGEIYDFIESEITAVLDILPTTVDQSTYGRMTKWTALAIRSKLYLNAVVFKGTPAYDKAAADAKAIIDGAKYNLEPAYADNFAVSNSGSSENILVYPYDKVFAGGFNWPMMTLHYASQGVYNFTAQPWNGYSAVEEFYNSYIDPAKNPGPQGPVWKGLAVDANNDKIPDDMGTLDSRLSNFVVGPQYKPDGTKAVDPGFEGPTAKQPDPDGTNLNFTPRINQLWPDGWRQGGARIGKYEYERGGTENMSNDFVIFRYSDILLTRAEALWRINPGDAEALSLVNQIRVRAEVDPYAALTADNLLAERGREMFAEMTRRQDLIRFGKFNDAWWEKAASTTTYNLFPIPKAQRDVNPKLQQNPGYPGSN